VTKVIDLLSLSICALHESNIKMAKQIVYLVVFNWEKLDQFHYPAHKTGNPYSSVLIIMGEIC
jgi:hypothetical protein